MSVTWKLVTRKFEECLDQLSNESAKWSVVLTFVPLDFIVNTVLIQYCVCYKFNETDFTSNFIISNTIIAIMENYEDNKSLQQEK